MNYRVNCSDFVRDFWYESLNNEIYELKERQGLVSQDHHLQDIVVHQEGMQLEVVVNKTKQQVPFYAWVFHLQEVPSHLFHMDLPPTPLHPWEW